MKTTMRLKSDTWPMREPFLIARGLIREIDVLVVELEDEQGRHGHGEAVGLSYDGETVATMQAQLDAVRDSLPATDGFDLSSMLPAGGARNALDCAYWDLRAKQTGTPAWRAAGLARVTPVQTALTLGIGNAEDFRRRVRNASTMPILKIKCNREHNVDLVRIAREERPHARLIVDANQAWDRSMLEDLVSELAALRVELIEQPVPRGADAQLAGYAGPIPLAADESCSDRASLAVLVGLYRFVSIKLDKTGGLTEALAVADEAMRLGFGLMVGNMGGTSLSMAPHFLIAQRCRYVDLDAPLIIRGDRDAAMVYEGSMLQPPSPELWG
jgi:L-alanine-DL-glutamate epimerase-like enolase superfamily enzyme